jgi:hypothetical protein
MMIIYMQPHSASKQKRAAIEIGSRIRLGLMKEPRENIKRICGVMAPTAARRNY